MTVKELKYILSQTSDDYDVSMIIQNPHDKESVEVADIETYNVIGNELELKGNSI